MLALIAWENGYAVQPQAVTPSICVGGERKHLYLRAPVPAVEIHVIEQRHLLPKAFLRNTQSKAFSEKMKAFSLAGLCWAMASTAMAGDINRQSIVFHEETPDVFYCPQEKPVSLEGMIVKARPLKALCEHQGRPLPGNFNLCLTINFLVIIHLFKPLRCPYMRLNRRTRRNKYWILRNTFKVTGARL